MRQFHGPSLVFWALVVPLVRGADVVDVTDIDIYTRLPPCVSSAVSWAIEVQTMSECDAGTGELQSCVCSNADLSSAVLSSIESSVSYGCGDTATDDQSTASRVLDKYCNPDVTFEIPTPTENIVNAYITDLAELSYMPACAASALSAAVMYETYARCPEDAVLFAPCVCSKPGVVEDVQETLTSYVKSSCSNNEDITVAENFYTEYCAMNNGTTTFAVPEGPPGDMTYHISALPQFQSLNSCAQTGLSSALLEQTTWNCAAGPQALASCVCFKSGMRSLVSSSLTYEVKWYCESTATADVSSALDVLDYYCSAADGEVTAVVDESISETLPAGGSRTNSGTESPSETGGTDGDSGTDDGSNTNMTRTAAIAGGAAGGVALIAIVAAVAICIRRKNKKNQLQVTTTPPAPPPIQHDYHGTPELVGSDRYDPKADIAASVSPAASVVYQPPPHNRAELAPQHVYRTELAASNQSLPYGYGQPQQHSTAQELPSPVYGYHNAHELSSPGYGYQQAHLHGQPVHEVQGSWSPVSPSPGWHSGHGEAYEMDANMGRRYQ